MPPASRLRRTRRLGRDNLDVFVTNWGGGVQGMADELFRNDDGTLTKITTGQVDVYTNLAVDQFLVAEEGAAVSPVLNEATPELAETLVLRQNYPNPFTDTTTIWYQLPRPAFVRLEVYDQAGRRVTTLVSRQVAAGTHEAVFDGRHLASGTYLLRLQAGGRTQVRTIRHTR